jgi:hypothetical protein
VCAPESPVAASESHRRRRIIRGSANAFGQHERPMGVTHAEE